MVVNLHITQKSAKVTTQAEVKSSCLMTQYFEYHTKYLLAFVEQVVSDKELAYYLTTNMGKRIYPYEGMSVNTDLVSVRIIVVQALLARFKLL